MALGIAQREYRRRGIEFVARQQRIPSADRALIKFLIAEGGPTFAARQMNDAYKRPRPDGGAWTPGLATQAATFGGGAPGRPPSIPIDVQAIAFTTWRSGGAVAVEARLAEHGHHVPSRTTINRLMRKFAAELDAQRREAA